MENLSKLFKNKYFHYVNYFTKRNLSINKGLSVENYKTKSEMVLAYPANSPERYQLVTRIIQILGLNFHSKNEPLFDIPIIIGDKQIRTDKIKYQVAPFDHSLKLARFYHADKSLINEAIENNLSVRAEWENRSFDYRAEIFLKAAHLIATEKRMDIVAATILGQGKTVHQAEIDSAVELIDFLKFNVQFLADMLKYKPTVPDANTVNEMFYRGLEGFVAAISPFNFTSIGGNLATAPALMGNVVLWKPSDNAVLSSYTIYKVLQDCGLPPGVINFVPSEGLDFGETITQSPDLAGINFTGSLSTFKWLWKSVGDNLDTFKTFPKLSGECGGKNFHLIHESADIKGASYATIRGAFEYSGQKCSATSRLYVPESKWSEMRETLISLVKGLKVDSPLKFDAFTSAVIDEKSFNKISEYIEYGKNNPDMELLVGGNYNKTQGYFIGPTIFETTNPKVKLMTEEIFGPVLTVYVYQDSQYEKTLELIDSSTPYALTGSIFCQNPVVLEKTQKVLRQSCGNLYVNIECTGAVVNQQPFGGARLSGTNDKPGGPYYLTRWTSPLSVKVFKGINNNV